LSIADIVSIIASAKLPKDLSDSTEEESVYSETAEEVQQDHKGKEAFDALKETATQQVQELKHNNATLLIQNENLKKLSEHRRFYSWAVLAFVAIVFFFTLTIVILSGNSIILNLPNKEFLILPRILLSEEVLLMLLGTNMVQVVGILWLVVKWLYPSNGKGTENAENIEQ